MVFMSDIHQGQAHVQDAQTERLREVWKNPVGWRRFSEVNNSVIGHWYTATAFAFLIFAGGLALLMRAQLAVPDNDLVTAQLYNQLFTMHGTAMMFLFAVPVFEGVAILILPAMLGARDLPFPRLSAFGYWSFLIGGVFVCGSIFFNAAPTGGWFMYPPLTTDTRQSGIGADIWLLGLSFIEVSSIAAAVELIVGVLKFRAPGMNINLTPLYAWYVLVVAGMILFAFPPLIVGDYLMELQRAFDWPFFDPKRGGDPLLWQHLFWIFGHPEVYIIFLPSIALLAMIVPTFAQRPIVGYSWIVLSALGTGFLSFGLWVHHMFTTGLPSLSLGFFSAASEAVAIPTGAQIFVFIATLALGKVVSSTPLLFAAGALAIFVFGGLTGVMLALAPFDFQAHDTYFVVAHLHYTLFGGMIFPLLAGVYYYYPFATGQKLSDHAGRVAFWLMFVGFNATFLPMHFTGLRGMPRRVFTYPADVGWDWFNFISSIGAFVFAVGFSVVLIDVLRPKKQRPDADGNPWNAGTLEWLAQRDESFGMRTIPIIRHRYPIWYQKNFVQDVREGRFYLPDAEDGRRESLVTSVLDAEPEQCARIPGPTFLTLFAAIFLGATFIFATYHWWISTLASAFLTLATVLSWLWTGTGEIPEKQFRDIGLQRRVPLYRSGPASTGWWAMFITMTGDLTAFLSLMFCYFFYWTIHTDFPPGADGRNGTYWLAGSACLVILAWASTLLARRLNTAGYPAGVRSALYAGVALGILGVLAMLAGPWFSKMDPTANVYPATVWAIVIWVAVHTSVGVIMQAYCIARAYAGRLTARYDMEIWNVTLYWHFACFSAVVALATLVAFPNLT
jgi:cytochrome c oxidase subunit I+III